ncbi:MAG: ABC transporter permease [Anderseniella sp.]|jgi:spermidine/putrescine transport system permease protein|nr:ABC transporter permease [Anderseniella sp.]
MSDNGYLDRPSRTLRAYAWVFMAVLYAPILLIPVFSLNDSIYIAFPLKGVTFDWYRELAENAPMWSALWNSVKVGLVTAVLSTSFGVFAAKAITRYRMPGKAPMVGFMMLPLVVPGIIFAVAILILMNRLGIQLSLYTVGLGHLLICIPFSIATLIPRFEGFDPSIEEASADLGEDAWWTFWRVTFPLVLPGVFASLMLTFTISFDEFIMAFFLAGTEQTLPMYIWGQLRFPDNLPRVLALSSIIIVISFVMVFASLWLSKLGLREASGGSNDPT